MGENFEERCFKALKIIQKDQYELNNNEKKVKTGSEDEMTLNIVKENQNNSRYFGRNLYDNHKTFSNNSKEKTIIDEIEEIDNEISKIKIENSLILR